MTGDDREPPNLPNRPLGVVAAVVFVAVAIIVLVLVRRAGG